MKLAVARSAVFAIGVSTFGVFIYSGSAFSQTVDKPQRSVTDPGVVTTRQSITPAGIPTIFQGRVYGVAFGATPAEVWVLTATQLYRLDWRANRILSRVAHSGPALQGLQYDPATGSALVAGLTKDKKTRLATTDGNQSKVLFEGQGSQTIGSPALVPGKLAAVPLTFDNKLAVVENSAVRTLPTEIAPFAVVIDKAGATAWVSNWGGRKPTAKDATAPTGLAANADQVVIDKRGIASTGTVSRIDLTGKSATLSIGVGLHPTGLALDEPRHRLYVANTNEDSISVIDTESAKLVRTIEIQPFTRKTPGIAPTALVVSADGKRLWAACGGMNAVAQIETATGRIEGLIPTAWYPNALSLSADGRFLAVATLLGPGSAWQQEPRKRFVHSYRGSVHVIELPGAAQLASYSTVVAENNHLALGSAQPMPAPRVVKATAIPERAGEPSLIEHVVYLIKENRTYDQVFGDVAKGNGDPSLVMFGEDVTPNQHRLAERFVVLDNFYASGGNSADGHQWLTQANETSYCLWPGYAGRSYPFDGTDPIAPAAKGFLWDYALARKKTVRVYGEYAGRQSEANMGERLELLDRWKRGGDFSKQWKIKPPIAAMQPIVADYYPAYSTAIPDVIRAGILLKDLAQWEQNGKMPNLVIAALPSDHTAGTRPGVSTPRAMVADNDLAVGQIVEALSKSRFWNKMAIFIVEDDAQNGVDHVDGHRTVALAISPYIRRGWVDSTFYSNQSMVKTIELIFGLPTMSLFDLIAHDMRLSFTDTPDLEPYTAVEPKQSLFEVNPPLTALRGAERSAAVASLKMRFEVPDAAPTEKLNRILWHSTRGWSTPYPGTRQAVFAPLSLDVDDDDRR